jgi:hypothetical protein
MVGVMEHAASSSGKVRVGLDARGATYLVDTTPEDLPPVRGRDLERAWYAAREAALAETWGSLRAFRFSRRDGTITDLALADRDACCWAAAVDRIAGLTSIYGLSLCLRLLALVELLARAPWAAPLCRLERDGADLDSSLLHAAAALPMTADARFDEILFRSRLGLMPPAVESAGASGALR